MDHLEFNFNISCVYAVMLKQDRHHSCLTDFAASSLCILRQVQLKLPQTQDNRPQLSNGRPVVNKQ